MFSNSKSIAFSALRSCSLTALHLTSKRGRLPHATAGHSGALCSHRDSGRPEPELPCRLPWCSDLQEAVSPGGMILPHHRAQLATSALERKGSLVQTPSSICLEGWGRDGMW